MNESLQTPVRPTERRLWPAVVLLLLVPVLLVVGGYLYFASAADRQLREAVAEAERLDPHWRLEEVEANRADVPDERNAAVWVRAAKRQVPAKWPVWEIPLPWEKLAALEASFQSLEPQRQLSAEQTTALRNELERAAAAVADARKLADLPEGRYSVAYSPDWINYPRRHAQDAREVAHLLEYDALLRAQDGDADGALASCRAALNAGRSLGDEPMLVSQLVRMACRAAAVERVQWVLAQGEPSDAALLQMQQLLEKEEPEPLLLYGVRGERGGMDRLLEALQTGKIQKTARQYAMDCLTDGDPAVSVKTLPLLSPAVVVSQRAAMLRHMNRFVEIAKLPPEQQEAPLKELSATLKGEPLLVWLLAPSVEMIPQAYRRSRADLRCAIAALAAERYRRATGHWPDRPEVLVEAGYLAQVPEDPYDGRPLRLRRLDDGLVIYSVGPDHQDDGGNLGRTKSPASGIDLDYRLWDVTQGIDLGFRLWDVTHRRQPPADGK
jgi:hypothetical protein